MIRVLVADDHPIVRGGIVALLESADDLTVVGEASTGLQAVELALEHEPDIVLMDLQMPELGGAEATARILEQRPGIRVIVLARTGTCSRPHRRGRFWRASARWWPGMSRSLPRSRPCSSIA